MDSEISENLQLFCTQSITLSAPLGRPYFCASYGCLAIVSWRRTERVAVSWCRCCCCCRPSGGRSALLPPTHHHRLPFPALALLSGVVLPAIICSTNADTLISNRAAKSAPRRTTPGQNKWRRADTSLLLPLDRPTWLSFTSFHTLSFFHPYSSLSGWPGCSYIIKR